MATQKKQAKNKQETENNTSKINKEKKLDIIIQEKKEAPKLNWTYKKALPALFLLLIISLIVYTTYNNSDVIGKTLPGINPAADDLQAAAQNPAQTAAQDQPVQDTNQFPANKDVAEVVDAKQNCTISEAQDLIKANLKSESSAAYIVSYIQNFDVQTYVQTYKKQDCKIYAPTRQQFQAFLRSRNYYDFQLTNSTVFVDYGEDKKSEQEYYNLIMSAKISKILSNLADVPSEGSSPKYFYNASGVVKQSY